MLEHNHNKNRYKIMLKAGTFFIFYLILAAVDSDLS